MNQSQNEKLSKNVSIRDNVVVDFAAVLAFISALISGFFYATYTAHNQGYLIAFGIDINVMEKPLHNVLYGGMLLCFSFASKIGVWWYLVSTFLFALVSAYVGVYRKSIRIKRKRAKAKTKSSSEPLGKIERLSIIFYWGFVLIFILLLFYGFFMWHFEQNGVKKANNIIKQFKEGEFSDFEDRLIQIENKKSIDTLLIVDCGGDVCAGINMASRHMVYFNKKTQKKFVSKNPVKQYKK